MRLIDADALLKALNDYGLSYRADINGMIMQAPTIEPSGDLISRADAMAEFREWVKLWKATQEVYFRRQRNLINATNTNKKPGKDDVKPLEINYLFKGATYQEEPITLEIAVYITDKILQAGYKGKPKTTEINYKTLLNECPRLRERLADIESKRGTLTDKGKPVNVTALYNLEFKKIKKAFDLIQNPDKCDALKEYEFIDIAPAKKINNSYFEFIPPTKSLINDKLIVKWKRKKTD